MAKIGKQWGAIIACWAVALTFIITGICLGVVIPSKAADENVVMVTCGDAVKYFTNINEVQTYVNHLPTTASQPATVTLLEDIHTVERIVLEIGKVGEGSCVPWVVLDLAGHILRSDKSIYLATVYAGSLTVIDSNPSVERYVTRNSTTDGVNYDFFDEVPLGTYADVIYGGVVTAPELMIASFYSGHELTINGGNYFGTGTVGVLGSGTSMTDEDKATYIEMFGFLPKQRVTINGGLIQVYTDNLEEDGLTGNYGVQVAYDGELVINGGSIFGKVAHETAYAEGYVDVDLSNPQTEMIKINANIKMQAIKDADGNLVGYSAVDAGTGEPITPDLPTNDQEDKPTPDAKTNLIGLIILGAAAAVMVVGVTTIIIVNTKKRKKVA